MSCGWSLSRMTILLIVPVTSLSQGSYSSVTGEKASVPTSAVSAFRA
jgi:hypothetical protein